MDEEVWEKPHQYAKGIDYVIVNGEIVLDHSQHTNAKPGKILRGAGLRSAGSPQGRPAGM
jgi:hypothetical protein